MKCISEDSQFPAHGQFQSAKLCPKTPSLYFFATIFDKFSILVFVAYNIKVCKESFPKTDDVQCLSPLVEQPKSCAVPSVSFLDFNQLLFLYILCIAISFVQFNVLLKFEVYFP